MSDDKEKVGVVYLRRSTNRQEISLEIQLSWAIGEAKKLGVRLDACMEDLALMTTQRLHIYKSIRLDDAISGANMERPGFLSLQSLPSCISHVFVYRRDRLARPEEASIMVTIEKSIRQKGVTFVLYGRIAPPMVRGDNNLGDDFPMYLEYYESGEFLIKHAERIISSKLSLAASGNWTGGRAPYGFVRVLVDEQGRVVEELSDGKRVRQKGCHVRIMPKDTEKLKIWCLILDLRASGWGGKRIANHLNSLNIPSPDAGRKRINHGKEHHVSGTWPHNTVLDLCKNKAIIGVNQLGKRSDGAHRRIGESGPRLLSDSDRKQDGSPKVVINRSDTIIEAKTGFAASYDTKKFNDIQDMIFERGKSQRGISRSKDLSRYPLALRVFDQSCGCGSVMYSRGGYKRKQYVCSKYMRNPLECEHNNVDADALLKFTMQTLKQLILQLGGRDALKNRLETLSIEQNGGDVQTKRETDTAMLKHHLSVIEKQKATCDRRLSAEEDDDIYKMLVNQSKQYKRDIDECKNKLARLHATTETEVNVQNAIDLAMSLFDSISNLTEDEESRIAIGQLVKQVGLKIGLNFASGIRGKTQKVRVLTGGVMTFGNRDLPVPNGEVQTIPELKKKIAKSATNHCC